LLYGKRIESEKARNYYLSRADDVLSAYLANATQDKIIKTHANIASNAIYPKYFENAKSLLTLILQPAYPFEPLTSPFELKDKIRDYQSNGHLLSEYPSSNVDAIPEGVADFNYHLDEITYQCNQIYSQGLLYYKLSIEDRKSNKNGVVNLQYLVGKILVFFKSAQKFYTLFGYQGTLKGNINLDNVRGVYVQPYSNGFPSDGCNLLLNNYVWNINLDTRILLDEGGLMQYYLNICNKIYWDLGFSYHYSEGNIKDYLRSIRLLPPV
jgi:hypothetical protein